MALAHLLLNNRYELIRPLGQGGMARVYLARDKFLGRQVAVKILHPSLSGDERFLSRFRREAEAAAALNHPHIVSVHDVGNDGDIYYIIMEYVEGMDLKELLLQNGPLSVRRAADVGFQVATALQYAHSSGLVHRDIKPHNIMVTPSGLVKVADFGIAKVLSEVSISEEANTIGTAQYISPEQAQNSTITAQTDIYSLGVVLYEAVTGFLPFPGENAVSIALAHVQQEPVAPSVLHTDVPPQFDQIILRAMAKNPKERFASADDMGRALQNWERETYNLGPTSSFNAISHSDGGGNKTAAGAAPPRKRYWGCLPWIIGVLTLLAILGAIPLTLWLLSNSNINTAAQPPTQTAVPIVAPATSVPTTPTATPTHTPTPLPTAAPTKRPTPKDTPPPAPTYGNTPTPTPTNTPTLTPTPTFTPSPTPTFTPTPLPTDTPTATPSPTKTPTPKAKKKR